jgi:hypothetical protein
LLLCCIGGGEGEGNFVNSGYIQYYEMEYKLDIFTIYLQSLDNRRRDFSVILECLDTIMRRIIPAEERLAVALR